MEQNRAVQRGFVYTEELLDKFGRDGTKRLAGGIFEFGHYQGFTNVYELRTVR